jgi:hypothetical protein
MLDGMGLVELVPQLDAQVQAALRNQEGFERWVKDPAAIQAAAQVGTSPLQWRRWYDPVVHRAQFVKWANSDRVQRMLSEKPQLGGLLDAYLIEVDMAIGMKMSGVIDVGPEMLELFRDWPQVGHRALQAGLLHREDRRGRSPVSRSQGSPRAAGVDPERVSRWRTRTGTPRPPGTTRSRNRGNR